MIQQTLMTQYKPVLNMLRSFFPHHHWCRHSAPMFFSPNRWSCWETDSQAMGHKPAWLTSNIYLVDGCSIPSYSFIGWTILPSCGCQKSRGLSTVDRKWKEQWNHVKSRLNKGSSTTCVEKRHAKLIESFVSPHPSPKHGVVFLDATGLGQVHSLSLRLDISIFSGE